MIPEEYIRKIIHVDMDAFYASVEQRDNPELMGKPVAVGGSKERGVVAAASYEARKYGVRSAMASSIAYRKCPHIIFVKPHFEKYKEVSKQIREIFFEYTDLVEPLSLDEAYLDVTENKKGIATATRIAKEIRQRIWEETQLSASAGISINKFVAKVASDINKPNGQKTIMPDDVIPFLENLPIKKFYGIGEKTAEKMKKLGIHFGRDLKQWDLPLLVREFGKSGTHYYNIVRGLQKSTVKPDRIRKSIGAERTFFDDIHDENDLKEELEKIMTILHKRIESSEASGKTVTLKLKSFDFEQHTRSFTFDHYINSQEGIFEKITQLLYQPFPEKPVRLLGITLSNLKNDESDNSQSVQLTLDF
ncbi:DNA polymerase IV [Owenweeksia hongkongensis]|uniref:DNA polymerase IV n=1 Tax=Owenweeksia hongkongensis TaxID=253245 RepID=UPI003A8FF23C